MLKTSPNLKGNTESPKRSETRLRAFEGPLWGNTDKRYTILSGGAGSGKTHAIIQYLCELFMTHEKCEFAVARKSNPALKRSVYMGSPSIVRQLTEWGLPMDTWHNKTDQIIRNPIKGNTLYFISIDDPEKIKSMNLNYIWMEEATEFNVEDFRQFNSRLRAPNPNGINRMWLSFNPISLYNWVYQWFIVNPDKNTSENSYIHRSRPFDNPFLPEEYVRAMISMGRKDENYYRVYIQGEPGVPSGLVFKNLNFTDVSTWPEEVWDIKPFYGLDFGFNDPMALVSVRKYDGVFYVQEEYFEREKHMDDMIHWLDSNKVNKSSYIFCDAASPERINLLQRAGYTAMKANKDVFAGINTVNSSDIHISIDSDNMLKESMVYQWKPKSSQTLDDVLKDEPLKESDHTMDAMRYAIYTYETVGKSSMITRLGDEARKIKEGDIRPVNY